MPPRAPDVYVRLPGHYRKPSTKRVRFPWRERKKRKQIPRSQAEKRELQKQRAEKKQKFKDALVEARGVVWELAAKMNEDFPGHSAEYYYRAIMQHSRLRNKRKISPWNVFVSQELKKLNAGELS